MKHCFRLFGCYELLDGGDLSEALADFSGGVSETIDLANTAYLTDEAQSDQFHDWLLRALNNRSLMCAAITVSDTLVSKLTNKNIKNIEYLYSEFTLYQGSCIVGSTAAASCAGPAVPPTCYMLAAVHWAMLPCFELQAPHASHGAERPHGSEKLTSYPHVDRINTKS